MSYIIGERLHDPYRDKTYRHYRHDVLWTHVFLPPKAPEEYRNAQTLCNEIEKAEARYDARTAREFIGALPNELPLEELQRIVYEFTARNFVENGLCAVAAIHEGKNVSCPERSNPHVHILISTRILGPDGFSKRKYRQLDKKDSLLTWREQWATVQNRAYKRYNLSARVTHESPAVQGENRKVVRLSPGEWREKKQLEQERRNDREHTARAHEAKLERDKEYEREVERKLDRKR